MYNTFQKSPQGEKYIKLDDIKSILSHQHAKTPERFRPSKARPPPKTDRGHHSPPVGVGSFGTSDGAGVFKDISKVKPRGVKKQARDHIKELIESDKLI